MCREGVLSSVVELLAGQRQSQEGTLSAAWTGSLWAEVPMRVGAVVWGSVCCTHRILGLARVFLRASG